MPGGDTDGLLPYPPQSTSKPTLIMTASSQGPNRSAWYCIERLPHRKLGCRSFFTVILSISFLPAFISSIIRNRYCRLEGVPVDPHNEHDIRTLQQSRNQQGMTCIPTRESDFAFTFPADGLYAFRSRSGISHKRTDNPRETNSEMIAG